MRDLLLRPISQGLGILSSVWQIPLLEQPNDFENSFSWPWACVTCCARPRRVARCQTSRAGSPRSATPSGPYSTTSCEPRQPEGNSRIARATSPCSCERLRPCPASGSAGVGLLPRFVKFSWRGDHEEQEDTRFDHGCLPPKSQQNEKPGRGGDGIIGAHLEVVKAVDHAAVTVYGWPAFPGRTPARLAGGPV